MRPPTADFGELRRAVLDLFRPLRRACPEYVEGINSAYGGSTQPDVRAAQETQKVCDAVLNSAKSGRWETV